jgi:hypothetical protein
MVSMSCIFSLLTNQQQQTPNFARFLDKQEAIMDRTAHIFAFPESPHVLQLSIGKS